jgi:hypothetical protein
MFCSYYIKQDSKVLYAKSICRISADKILHIMSKQKGLIKLEGNIGGISFYVSDGEYLARMANGPSKERIANDPAFKRTRENNKEFGGSARVAKAMRISLSSVLMTMAGSKLVSRLTGFFKSINTKGVGMRGERPITLSTNKEDLVGFNLDKKTSFSSVCSAPFTFTNHADRNEGTIAFASFIPANNISAPGGATHFKLVTAIGTISDYILDGDTRKYEPVEPTFNALGDVARSNNTPLNNTAVTINLVATLAGSPVIPADVSVVQCVGIEFYQKVGANFYILSQKNCMKVANVF